MYFDKKCERYFIIKLYNLYFMWFLLEVEKDYFDWGWFDFLKI